MREELSTANGVFVKPKEYPFFDSDDKKLYAYNYTHFRDRLTEEGWIPLTLDEEEGIIGHRYLYNPENNNATDWVNLSYKINTHGFRSEEMPTAKKPRSILCLGCSITFGVGMPVGQIWPTLIGNTFKYRAYNLGVPGGSLDKAFRLLLHWLPKIRPHHVFLLQPPEPRYEIITTTWGVTNSSSQFNQKPAAFRYEHEDEWMIHKEKTMRAIQSVCDQFETPFTSLPCNVMQDTYKIGRHDFARDLQHPGRNCHIYAAMSLLKKAGYNWDVEHG